MSSDETTQTDVLPPSGRYIVKSKHVDVAARIKTHTPSESSDMMTSHWDVFSTFAGIFGEAMLEDFNSDPHIHVEPDVTVGIDTIQNNAPWGLGRLSRIRPQFIPLGEHTKLNFAYIFVDGVEVRGETDVYVVDTGIYTDHNDFGGRARWGATFGKDHNTGKKYADVDAHGHGTHCAGIIGGNIYGVDKHATLIAVRVLNDGGHGYLSDVISGLHWISQQITASRRHSIISMSLRVMPASDILDGIVNYFEEQGVHVIVSAGNNTLDANTQSPARATGAITVGASTHSDAVASLSNHGPCVDIFAPGKDVVSASIGSKDNWTTRSGTSQACPHVAGLISHLIRIEGYKTPAQMKERILKMASAGVLSEVPKDTVNLLVHNEIPIGMLDHTM